MDEGIKHLVIIAGPQSNNLLAALQMAREHQLQVSAFLLKPWSDQVKGNYKLSRLFLDDKDIIWVKRADWVNVASMAQKYCDQLQAASFVLSEGASVAEALPGAMTLADDIALNEQNLGFNFQHIFIDAGTGFAASALIQGLAQRQHAATVHVLLLAEDIAAFNSRLKLWLGAIPHNYNCFYPTTAKAFGSVNLSIKNEIKRLAREEGILADPIYSAKLFHETRAYLQSEKLTGKVLIIHSGGVLSLAGFDFN